MLANSFWNETNMILNVFDASVHRGHHLMPLNHACQGDIRKENVYDGSVVSHEYKCFDSFMILNVI